MTIRAIENAEASPFHNLPRQPAGDEADENEPEDVHATFLMMIDTQRMPTADSEQSTVHSWDQSTVHCPHP